MEASEYRLRDLEDRLARAERRFRTALASISVVVLASATIGVLAGNARCDKAQDHVELGRTLRANRLILEDSSGTARAMLTATAAGMWLALVDEQDTVAVRAALLLDWGYPGRGPCYNAVTFMDWQSGTYSVAMRAFPNTY